MSKKFEISGVEYDEDNFEIVKAELAEGLSGQMESHKELTQRSNIAIAASVAAFSFFVSATKLQQNALGWTVFICLLVAIFFAIFSILDQKVQRRGINDDWISNLKEGEHHKIHSYIAENIVDGIKANYGPIQKRLDHCNRSFVFLGAALALQILIFTVESLSLSTSSWRCQAVKSAEAKPAATLQHRTQP